MTNNTSYLDDIIPGFEVMKWKEETQAEILRETEGMTQEEILAYFHSSSERAILHRQTLVQEYAG